MRRPCHWLETDDQVELCSDSLSVNVEMENERPTSSAKVLGDERPRNCCRGVQGHDFKLKKRTLGDIFGSDFHFGNQRRAWVDSEFDPQRGSKALVSERELRGGARSCRCSAGYRQRVGRLWKHPVPSGRDEDGES